MGMQTQVQKLQQYLGIKSPEPKKRKPVQPRYLLPKDAWLDELPNLVLPSVTSGRSRSPSPAPKSCHRRSASKSPAKSYHQVAQSVVLGKFASLRQEMLDAATKALTQYF
jgi:hypothetical protein